jgi:hypothetical protein
MPTSASSISGAGAATFIATSSSSLRIIRPSSTLNPGRFFLAHIRDRFPYERMAKLQAA